MKEGPGSPRQLEWDESFETFFNYMHEKALDFREIMRDHQKKYGNLDRHQRLTRQTKYINKFQISTPKIETMGLTYEGAQSLILSLIRAKFENRKKIFRKAYQRQIGIKKPRSLPNKNSKKDKNSEQRKKDIQGVISFPEESISSDSDTEIQQEGTMYWYPDHKSRNPY